MTYNRTKQPPPALSSLFKNCIHNKIYSTYESDEPFTLQLQVRVQYADLTYHWQAFHTALSGLAHAGQTGSVQLWKSFWEMWKHREHVGAVSLHLCFTAQPFVGF